MARLRRGRTGFVIARWLSSEARTNTTAVTDAGRSVEQGTRHDLPHRRSFRYELCNSRVTEGMAEGG